GCPVAVDEPAAVDMHRERASLRRRSGRAVNRLVYPNGETPGANRRDREGWHHQGGDNKERVDFHPPFVRGSVGRVLWGACDCGVASFIGFKTTMSVEAPRESPRRRKCYRSPPIWSLISINQATVSRTDHPGRPPDSLGQRAPRQFIRPNRSSSA